MEQTDTVVVHMRSRNRTDGVEGAEVLTGGIHFLTVKLTVWSNTGRQVRIRLTNHEVDM
ncbi:hypothetical protein JMJ77_0009697 [Colletotrichum scovillei]|uniref:Uncharacterized protein n=1 Tax=Colletotrichum scovillei TaxID=1209932 RepID=A0A9P7QYA9_9PEZI|nr:hypothetical protein JMJ77_0009697 [Colletotrichum scovillei]KAG7052780.1 hypothetical protein JMJ78_0005791 [Colletotrichum scovillei]KAG7065047.1 hypothetical protein JMJ76_0012799 [Colletotrichum scovillei]